jgi:hypothetical protein
VSQSGFLCVLCHPKAGNTFAGPGFSFRVFYYKLVAHSRNLTTFLTQKPQSKTSLTTAAVAVTARLTIQLKWTHLQAVEFHVPRHHQATFTQMVLHALHTFNGGRWLTLHRLPRGRSPPPHSRRKTRRPRRRRILSSRSAPRTLESVYLLTQS